MSKNPITGDTIQSKIGNQKAYENGWEAIFGRKPEKFKFQYIHKDGCGKPASLVNSPKQPYERIVAEDWQHLDGTPMIPMVSEIRCDACGQRMVLNHEWIEPAPIEPAETHE